MNHQTPAQTQVLIVIKRNIHNYNIIYNYIYLKYNLYYLFNINYEIDKNIK